MAKKKKAKVSKRVVKEVKEKSLMDNLVAGNWIDKLTDGWGKPKSYNKDWNK